MKIQTATLKSIFIAVVVNISMMTDLHAQEWTLTPQTHIGFEINSMNFFVLRGHFEQVQSSMHFDPEAPQNAYAEFVLDINSLSLNRPALKPIILAEALFYAEKYPTATFNSHEFIVLGQHKYNIKGELSLRGVTRPIILETSLKPNITNPDLLDFESKTVVNFSDFGMKSTFAGIGEKVNIKVSGQWKVQ